MPRTFGYWEEQMFTVSPLKWQMSFGPPTFTQFLEQKTAAELFQKPKDIVKLFQFISYKNVRICQDICDISS